MFDTDTNELILEEVASKLSEQTRFDIDRDDVFFHVREGFASAKQGEGFAKEIRVISEMLNGHAIIDGWNVFDLSIGDHFYCTASPDHALNCLELGI